MKKCLLCCLAVSLFCGLFFGCSPKDLPASLSEFTWEGEVCVTHSTQHHSLPFANPEALKLYETNEEIRNRSERNHAITVANAPGTQKEYEIGGKTYTLTRTPEIILGGVRAFHYGLRAKDITEETLAQIPEAYRAAFRRDDPEDFVGWVSFDRAGDVVSFNNLPGGPFGVRGKSKDEIRDEAIAMAKAYTNEPFETYHFTLVTVYRTSQGEKIHSGYRALEEGESLVRYEVSFERSQNGKTDGLVRVLFPADKGVFFEVQKREFTDAEYEKINAVDEENLKKQAKAFVEKQLAPDWKLTQWQPESITPVKKGEQLFLYVCAKAKAEYTKGEPENGYKPEGEDLELYFAIP